MVEGRELSPFLLILELIQFVARKIIILRKGYKSIQNIGDKLFNWKKKAHLTSRHPSGFLKLHNQETQ